MPIAFAVGLLAVVGLVIWFAFYHASPTSQVSKPAFSSPAVGSKPAAGASQTLGDFINDQSAKGNYGV